MRVAIISALLMQLSIGSAMGADISPEMKGKIDAGIAAYRQENYEEAVAQLQELNQMPFRSGLVAFYLGLALKQTGEIGKAKEQLRAATDAQPPVLDAYLELAELAYTQDDLTEAMSWVSKAEKQSVKPGSTAFLRGMILAKQGESTAAFYAFDQAKSAAPELSQSVAMQQALLLVGNRRYSEAQSALRTVLTIDPSSDLATYARDYEQLLKRATEAHRNWHLKVGIGGVYDDNVVAQPDADIPQAEITNRSDLGFVGTFQLDYTPVLPKGWLFSGHYALQSTTYGTISTHDTIQHAVTLVPGLELGRNTLTLPVSYNHMLLGEENYLGQATVRPTFSVPLSDAQFLQLSAGYSRREMQQPPLDSDENRDANLFMAGTSYGVSFGSAPLTLSLRYEFTYDRAVGTNWENRGHRVASSLLLPVSSGVALNLGVDAMFQKYLRNHTLQSFGNKRRDDLLLNGSCGISWNFNNGYTAIVQYTHSNALSNIDEYDYQRNQVNVGLEFGF